MERRTENRHGGAWPAGANLLRRPLLRLARRSRLQAGNVRDGKRGYDNNPVMGEKRTRPILPFRLPVRRTLDRAWRVTRTRLRPLPALPLFRLPHPFAARRRPMPQEPRSGLDALGINVIN